MFFSICCVPSILLLLFPKQFHYYVVHRPCNINPGAFWGITASSLLWRPNHRQILTNLQEEERPHDLPSAVGKARMTSSADSFHPMSPPEVAVEAAAASE